MAQPEIAELIERSADELVRRWTAAVRADEGIQSDEDLSEGGLVDHVPFMIEELCELLRAGGAAGAADIREARLHAYTRFRQGYRARDLIRESSHLRLILLDHLHADLLRASPDGERLARYVAASRTVNRYLDEEMRYAVSIYTEELRPV
jgi:hypothetical protein